MFDIFRSRAPILHGYQQPELVDVVFRKTKAYTPQGYWPEMLGVETVLDFGGACGLHYKLAVLESPGIRWAVVETPAMAARAADLATDRLQFFSSIEAAARWLGDIDVMHSNGALQYTPAPLMTLAELCALKARAMIWSRMSFAPAVTISVQTSRLTDNGPGRARGVANKRVQYVETKIPESDFIAAHAGYDLAERSENAFRFVIRP